jgi:quercetin dioxygenase-like cupin family protein
MQRTMLSLPLLASVCLVSAHAVANETDKTMNQPLQTIVRSGSQPAVTAPAQFFTGQVRIAPLFSANESAPVTGAYVTFEPGARSHWHTHPTGQRLIVTAGTGRTGEWGGKVEEIKVGDIIWCPPGVKHWHGASPTSAMTHIALTGTLADGKNVEWMEPVTDEQYSARLEATK